jgi:hypothetical protein
MAQRVPLYVTILDREIWEAVWLEPHLRPQMLYPHRVGISSLHTDFRLVFTSSPLHFVCA